MGGAAAKGEAGKGETAKGEVAKLSAVWKAGRETSGAISTVVVEVTGAGSSSIMESSWSLSSSVLGEPARRVATISPSDFMKGYARKSSSDFVRCGKGRRESRTEEWSGCEARNRTIAFHEKERPPHLKDPPRAANPTKTKKDSKNMHNRTRKGHRGPKNYEVSYQKRANFPHWYSIFN